jgi:hypothetical protein
MKTLRKFKKLMTKKNLRKAAGAVLRTVFKAALRLALGKILSDALDLVVAVFEDDEDGPPYGSPHCTAAA